jgi:hypothetical protein
MKVQLEIPLAEYQQLIAMCDPKSPEYRHFRNGIIDNQIVKILFTDQTAHALYECAVQKCPAAAEHIRRGIQQPVPGPLIEGYPVLEFMA